MKALVLGPENKTARVEDVQRPEPGPNEVLVKVEAIALNPVDATFTYHPLGKPGRVVGSDFCGMVVTPAAGLAAGQRVAGFLQGACSVNDRPGAFAEYLVCPADLFWKVPDTVSAEEAAAVNLCGLTAAQGIFYRFGLPAPFAWESSDKERVAPDNMPAAGDPLTFFIYGASTSVGLYAAQLVRHSAVASGRPLKLIGAASKARFEMLRAEPYLYDGLVDYHDADRPEQVRQLAGGGGVGVHFAYDTISRGHDREADEHDTARARLHGHRAVAGGARVAGRGHAHGADLRRRVGGPRGGYPVHGLLGAHEPGEESFRGRLLPLAVGGSGAESCASAADARGPRECGQRRARAARGRQRL